MADGGHVFSTDRMFFFFFFFFFFFIFLFVFVLVLAQLGIEGNILTKISNKSDQWSWSDNKPVNGKFHLSPSREPNGQILSTDRDFFLYLHNKALRRTQ